MAWRAVLTAGVIAAASTTGAALSLAASPSATVLELECRREGEEWQACQMGVVKVGEEWWLDLANRRIRFLHDGSGIMRMKESSQPGWRPVQARWIADRTLCWNGICARGDLPLD